jgi:predicted DNA-binding transcriptional regulator AlpA
MDQQQLAVRGPKAAELLGVSESWLEKARVTGTGPRFVKISQGVVGYLIRDLEEFLQSRRRRSTADAPSPVARVSDPPRTPGRRDVSARRRATTQP